MASDSVPRSKFDMLGLQISKVLTTHIDPMIPSVYPEHSHFFGGRVKRNSAPFKDAGLEKRYKLQRPINAKSLGATGSVTSFPTPEAQQAYDNIIYRDAHMLISTTAGEYNWFNQQQLTDDAVAALATTIAMEASQAIADTEDVLYMSDVRQFFGDVAVTPTIGGSEAAPTGDLSIVARSETVDSVAYTGYYLLTLKLGMTTIPPLYKMGRLLHIAAWNGSNLATEKWTGTALNRVRNYGVPAIVASYVKSDYGYTAGDPYRVDVKFPFTVSGGGLATSRDTVYAMIGAIAAGDVICPWGGATAATGTMPSAGPNYGTTGLRHWYSQQNIETCGIWCSTALQSLNPNANTFGTVNRADATYGFLVPYLDTTSSAFKWSLLDNLARNVRFRRGGDALDNSDMIVMNEIMLQAAAEAGSGVTGMRYTQAAGEELAKRFSYYGMSGATYQGLSTATPMPLAMWDMMPLDMILCCKPENMEILEPFAPQWYSAENGSVFHDVTLTSGTTSAVTPRKRCHRVMKTVLHYNKVHEDGGLTGVYPK